jgi:hypothetical protein
MTTAAGVLSARAAIVWTMKPDNFTVVLLIFLVHYRIMPPSVELLFYA